MIRSRKILNHARGKECQLALPGICGHNPETTVFAHLNSHGKGMGMKTHDFAGVFADYECHRYLDVGHGTHPQMSDLELSQALLKAVIGTWLVLIEDHVIIVPIDPKPAKTIKPRLPAEKRTAIPKSSRKIPSKPLVSRGRWPKKEA